MHRCSKKRKRVTDNSISNRGPISTEFLVAVSRKSFAASDFEHLLRNRRADERTCICACKYLQWAKLAARGSMKLESLPAEIAVATLVLQGGSDTTIDK